MTIRLDWTGNHLIDIGLIKAQAARIIFSPNWDPSQHGEPFLESLRFAISATFGVNHNNLAITAGSSAGLDAILRQYRYMTIVDCSPSFRAARLAAEREQRLRIVLAPRRPDEILDLVSKMTDRSGLLMLSSPSNPLGWEIPYTILEAILLIWQGPVVVDEAYADYAECTALTEVGRFKNLWVTRTFSKAWGLADLRIGFIASQQVNQTFRERLVLRYPVGGLAAGLALDLLKDPGFVHQSIAQAKRLRAQLVDDLDLLGLSVEGASSSYVCALHNKAEQIEHALFSSGICVKRVSALCDWPSSWGDGLRISIGLQSDIDRLISCISKVLHQ